MFTLGAIDPFYVEKFGGFNRPRFVSVVNLLGDGGAGPDQVLQSSGIPMRQATVTGWLTKQDDVDTIRGYDDSKEVVAFVDGNGNSTMVVLLELDTIDLTDRWTFTMTLIATGDTTPPGS